MLNVLLNRTGVVTVSVPLQVNTPADALIRPFPFFWVEANTFPTWNELSHGQFSQMVLLSWGQWCLSWVPYPRPRSCSYSSTLLIGRCVRWELFGWDRAFWARISPSQFIPSLSQSLVYQGARKYYFLSSRDVFLWMVIPLLMLQGKTGTWDDNLPCHRTDHCRNLPNTWNLNLVSSKKWWMCEDLVDIMAYVEAVTKQRWSVILYTSGKLRWTCLVAWSSITGVKQSIEE